ncbi:MFS transporter [Actinokineospora bangkokensis]|uniref:Major facilitator superfamily (MFS) profile domain-containing protein n=1 Tax=Actinokineospora bangkokensis TaxID=1193682 RepID=A0A1Q9LLX1_9PSEU|nr:MFS transporter [Actinokineospora bangkokensis]OLR93020.1 hypothetical protein BJP25_18850 [Actinokineospora bangkokensis]
MTDLSTAPTRTEQGRTLGVVALGTFLALLLFTTPMPQLGALAVALGAGPAAQTWVLSSMSVGLAAGMLVTGVLGDDHGRRRVFAAGAVVVALTSLLSVATTSSLVFVLARVGHGLGSAALISCGLGMIGHTFPAGPARVRATGVWGASVGAGIALGPIAAALLADWRLPYLVTAALGALTALATRAVPESTSGDKRRVDLPGAVLLGSGLSVLLVGLVTGRSGWTRPTAVVALALGVALLVAFAAVERRSPAPLLDLGLFRRPDFVAVTVAALATGLGVIATMSFSPTLLIRGLGEGPVAASLGVLLWSGTSVPVALLARRLRWSGDVQLAVGLGVVAVGLLLLLDPSGVWALLPGFFVCGLGSGVLNAALGRQAVASVPAGRGGMGSGANNTARYVGSAIGVTVFAVIAARPTPQGVVSGWEAANVVTAAFSVLGAVGVLLCLRRSRA